jgi:hypothetical protein
MTTPAEYRQFAQECIESARAATSEAARKQFLDIAKLWLMAARHLDGGPSVIDGLDGHALLKQDGMAPNEPS